LGRERAAAGLRAGSKIVALRRAMTAAAAVFPARRPARREPVSSAASSRLGAAAS